MIEPYLADDAFLADVAAAPGGESLLHLWWLGQSGFLVRWNGRDVLIDPYLSDSLTKKYAGTDKPHTRMSRRVVDPSEVSPDLITASHGHTDHLDPETLKAIRHRFIMSRQDVHPAFVAPRAIGSLAEERWGWYADALLDDAEVYDFGFGSMIAVASAHEAIDRNERGWCLYLGYVFRLGPFTLYHSGDTVLYDGLADRLAALRVDIALLPINGRAPERRVAGNLWGREAAWLAKEIGARVVIPCHYDMFEFNTATPDEFVAECERLGQPYRVLRQGERFSRSELMPR